MSSNSLVLTPINGEPRIQDLLLAEQLEFERPAKNRDLIKNNEDRLLKFGIIPTVGKIHQGAGRPANEFYLNQKQAIFICMKSETEKAFDVQVEIVHAFDAYLNGNLDGKIASQPRLHFVLRSALRTFDLTHDAWAKQIAANQIKVLCANLGIAVPDMALVGKPADQMQLEV